MSSFDLTPERVPQPVQTEQRRISGPAEVIRGRMIVRRKTLWQQKPEVVNAACEGMAALVDIADRHAASLRIDKSERQRQNQFEGCQGLQSEDLFAIAMEDKNGRAAVLAWARVLLATMGYEATPTEVTAEQVHEALAVVSECASAVEADTIRALGDNTIDEAEAMLVAKRTRRLEDAAVTLRAAARFASMKNTGVR